MTTKRFSDYAVVYDISNDKERTRVRKLLQGYGFGIQKSVFECRMTVYMYKKLQAELLALQIKTGFVKIYRLVYMRGQQGIGEKTPKNIDDGPAFIV
ncbi:MAG: CRISPR-associated endonuclease Cas2 [bacterium]